MIMSVCEYELLDLDFFIRIPLHRILIEFLNLPLFLWVDTNSNIQYARDMSNDDYITYQLNDLITNYLNKNTYEELEKLQSDLKSLCYGTFFGHSATLPKLFTPEDDINYTIGYDPDEKLFEMFRIKSIAGYCVFALARLSTSDIVIRKCENCGKFFVPSARSDEIYCDHIFKGDKTCKQIGYERKVQRDEFLKAYRTAYKTKNAFKLRNSRNIPDIENRFTQWAIKAKEKLEEARSGKISLDEFSSWLKSDM